MLTAVLFFGAGRPSFMTSDREGYLKNSNDFKPARCFYPKTDTDIVLRAPGNTDQRSRPARPPAKGRETGAGPVFDLTPTVIRQVRQQTTSPNDEKGA